MAMWRICTPFLLSDHCLSTYRGSAETRAKPSKQQMEHEHEAKAAVVKAMWMKPICAALSWKIGSPSEMKQI